MDARADPIVLAIAATVCTAWRRTSRGQPDLGRGHRPRLSAKRRGDLQPRPEPMPLSSTIEWHKNPTTHLQRTRGRPTTSPEQAINWIRRDETSPPQPMPETRPLAELPVVGRLVSLGRPPAPIGGTARPARRTRGRNTACRPRRPGRGSPRRAAAPTRPPRGRTPSAWRPGPVR
jgi:hypothetical protein